MVMWKSPQKTIRKMVESVVKDQLSNQPKQRGCGHTLQDKPDDVDKKSKEES